MEGLQKPKPESSETPGVSIGSIAVDAIDLMVLLCLRLEALAVYPYIWDT